MIINSAPIKAISIKSLHIVVSSIFLYLLTIYPKHYSQEKMSSIFTQHNKRTEETVSCISMRRMEFELMLRLRENGEK